MSTHSAAHALQYKSAGMSAGLLMPMRTRTSLPMLVGRGWAGIPLSEGLAGTGQAAPALALTSHRGFACLDTERIRGLLEGSFHKAVAPGYFDLQATQVIVAGDYAGIAIIKSIAGVPYLDKLAVAPEGQGKGLGQALWERIREDNPGIMWRAAAKNPANKWYTRLSDGAVNTGEWMVFWAGMDAEAAKPLIPVVASLPRTMLAYD